MFTISPRSRSIARRARHALADIEHAQRRMFEIRTSLPDEAQRPTVSVAELERLYTYGTPLRMR